MHYVDDWTHHHMVFSDPGTRDDAERRGKLEEWKRITADPRYLLQQGKRTHSTRPVMADPNEEWRRDDRGRHHDHGDRGGHGGQGSEPVASANAITKDWNVPLGGGAAMGSVTVGGLSGAYNVYSGETLTIGATTLATASAPTFAKAAGGFTNYSTGTLKIVNGGNTLNLTYTNAANGTCTGAGPTWTVNVFQGSNGSGTNSASNTAIVLASGSNCSNDIGLTATNPSNANLTLTANTAGTGSNGITLNWDAGNSRFNQNWNGQSFTTGNGNNGITEGTNSTAGAGNFAYWGGSTFLSSAAVAANIATAVTGKAYDVTATATNGVVTFTALTSGAGGDYTIASTFPPLAGLTLTGGSTVAATVMPDATPAKYGPSLTAASCTSDFVIYPTGQAGSGTAATIIAYNNIYSGCATGAVPSVMWAYNTGTGYSVTTSPVLSWDGTAVAFVQTGASGSQLVILKGTPTGGQGFRNPGGTFTTPTSMSACPASTACMITVNLTNPDTYSSPFYDYAADDAIYVGDNKGYLELITGVFTGTPSVATAINLGNNNPLASPVLDATSGCVFVGDTTGFLYSVSSQIKGTVCNGGAFATFGHTGNLGNGAANDGIFDAPIVDSTAGQVYAFVTHGGSVTTSFSVSADSSSVFPNTIIGTGGTGGTFTTAEVGDSISGDGITGADTIVLVSTFFNSAIITALPTCTNNNPPYTCGPYTFTLTRTSSGNNVIDRFATSTITSGSTGAGPAQSVYIGTGGTGFNLYSGTFDNIYFTSTNSASPVGNLYAIGDTATTGGAGGASLYQIPISGGAMGGPLPVVTGLNATGYAWPSPLTEFNNNGTDLLFFSVNAGASSIGGTTTGCTGVAGSGCIFSYNITTTTPALIANSALNVKTPSGTNGCWATDGIVIDNSAALAGAQQIYFVELNGGTAGSGSAPASTSCTTGTAAIIDAVQASQTNP